jgi:hypothetical protein
MKNQEETNVDALNQDSLQPAPQNSPLITERTSSEEWKKRLARQMEILGSKMDYSDAGKCFVMPYKIRRK